MKKENLYKTYILILIIQRERGERNEFFNIDYQCLYAY